MRSNLFALVVMLPLLFSSVAVPAYGASAKEQVLMTVEEALNAWKHENWSRMYSFLSDRDQKKTPFNTFVKKRRTLAIAEKLANYRIIAVKVIQSNEASANIELFMLKGPQAQFFPTKKWVPEKDSTKWHLIRETDGEWKITFVSQGNSTDH